MAPSSHPNKPPHPPLPEKNSNEGQTQIPSQPSQPLRHMSLPATKRSKYENHTAIRAHRLNRISGREASFTSDSRPRPWLNHDLPSHNSHRSLSRSRENRKSSSLQSRSGARGRRSQSQNWSQRDHPTITESQEPLPASWRNQTSPQFLPVLSPIPPPTTQAEESTSLSSVLSHRGSEFSSSEYVNFSPSRSPVFPIEEEPVLECQPYLDCKPRESHLDGHPYDIEGEEDSFETEDSFEDTTNEAYSNIYEVNSDYTTGDVEDNDLDSQHSDTYEKIPQ